MAEAAEQNQAAEAETTPEPAPAPQPEAPVVTEEKAPFFRIMDNLTQLQNNLSKSICNVSDTVSNGVRKTLRHEPPGEAGPQPILWPPKAPLHAAGNILDAKLLTAPRRLWEGTESLGSIGRATYRSLTRPLPFFHMKETFSNPGQYLANIGRVGTATANAARRVLLAAPRALDDLTDRGIARPLTNFSLGWLGKAVKFVGSAPKKIFEWGTNWIKGMDNWMKQRQ